MIIDCVFCASYIDLYKYNVLMLSVGVLMISPNTGHIHSSSMYDGDMETGRWMDLAIDN